MTKPDKKTVFMSIRLTEELREQIRQQADANTRTLAAQVLHYIKQGMANEEGKGLSVAKVRVD